MTIQTVLKSYGLSDKEVAVYTALLELGPSPVRAIAVKSEVNRGTTYDILKSLMAEGLVSYFNKATKQYFSVEPPEKIITALAAKQDKLEQVKRQVTESLPDLKSLYEREGGKPQVRLYEGAGGVRQILEDVLLSVGAGKDRFYYVYSAATVRHNVHLAMPDFSKRRIKQKIKVQTIALGAGGQLMGLDERKWMVQKEEFKATYELIYAGKVAHISLDVAGSPVGVVIENVDIYTTQKAIFQKLWSAL